MKWTYDLVVLIDCWPSHYDVFTNDDAKITEFYKRLVNKLKTMRFTNVALATYINNDSIETDPWLLDHLKSEDQGSNLNLKHCLTFQDVFRKFPELLLNTEKTTRILIGGLAYYHCVHWRPLGIMRWIQQGMPVYTCVDICAGGKWMAINENMLLNDPFATWVKELPDEADLSDEIYDDIWKAKNIGQKYQEIYKGLIPYQYSVSELPET